MRKCALFLVISVFSLAGGCPDEIDVEIDSEFQGRLANLANAAGLIQTRPQELPPVLIEQNNTIIIDNSVTIIEDIDEEIVFEELPNITIIGFTNDTGFDIYIRYFVDFGDGFGEELQGIFVFDGETLLLEYPCLEFIALDTEEDIDPFTGELVQEFDISDVTFENGFEFECGDALLLLFDPFEVSAELEYVELLL